MVSQLVDDHELIIRNLREHVDACANNSMIRVQLTSNWLDAAKKWLGCCVPSLKVNHSDPMVPTEKGSRSGEVVDSKGRR